MIWMYGQQCWLGTTFSWSVMNRVMYIYSLSVNGNEAGCLLKESIALLDGIELVGACG